MTGMSKQQGVSGTTAAVVGLVSEWLSLHFFSGNTAENHDKYVWISLQQQTRSLLHFKRVANKPHQ